MKSLTTKILTLMASSAFFCMNVQADTSEHSGDWASPQALVAALYETVSIEPGGSADWDRFRDLFADGAQLVMALESSQISGLMATDVEGLITQSQAVYASTGFIERELDQHVLEFGNMASVYSTFDIRYKESDPDPLMRGLNHFQLLNDGDRWYIISNSSVLETSNWKLPENLAASIE